ncbi:MAG: CapA family protein [Woeseiaceae bacterium]
MTDYSRMPAAGRSDRPMLAGLLMILGACATAPDGATRRAPEPAAPPPAHAPQPESAPAPAIPAGGQALTIAAVGDMMLGTDYPENHLPDDDGAGFLAAVAPVLAAADLTFGNLEGVLVDGGVPRKTCHNASACFLFRSPSRYVDHFLKAGFDVLSLANNHSRDFGEEGRTATMHTLDSAGILHSGRKGDFASVRVNGLDIAVLAFAVTQKSNLMHAYAAANRTVSRFASSHDIVVVSFHGGAEGSDMTRIPFEEEIYFGEPRGDVVRFSRGVVDAGADLVLGHGPHVVRGMERYRDRLIAYSLGNFATYYGISVDGLNGIAPILVATLDGEGRFIEGRIHSTVQLRPGGPVIDERRQALRLIRDLSKQDFVTPGVRFETDGRIVPEERTTFVKHEIEPARAN